MEVRLKRNTLGYNAGCDVCGKIQEGYKPQPLIIWYRKDNEKRGHNIPICCQECAHIKLLEFAKGA